MEQFTKDAAIRDLKQYVGIEIRKARIARRLTQPQLAELAGMTQAAISKIENGDTDMKLSTLAILRTALALDITIKPLGRLLKTNNTIINHQNTTEMKTILFKTRKEAEAYIRDNYTDYTLRSTYITEESDYDTDIRNLCWQGEATAWDVIDANGANVFRAAWWEEGDDVYKLLIDDKVANIYDNIIDAREAYEQAAEAEKYADEPRPVTLLCNDEDITD